MEPSSSAPYAVVFGFGVALLALASSGARPMEPDRESSKAELVVRCDGRGECVEAVEDHFDACVVESRSEEADRIAGCIVRRVDGRVSFHP